LALGSTGSFAVFTPQISTLFISAPPEHADYKVQYCHLQPGLFQFGQEPVTAKEVQPIISVLQAI